jgi:uncharacterized Rmd1/YagE family protein
MLLSSILFVFLALLSPNHSLLHLANTLTHRCSSSLFSINKRSFGTNLGIPQKPVKNSAAPDVVRRRKVGPPQRSNKLNPMKEEALAAGRVSVYCLGSGLDLQALRAQVFRRGIKSPSDRNSTDTEENLLNSGLIAEDSADNEVLHVSNAPLFISVGKKGSFRSEITDGRPTQATPDALGLTPGDNVYENLLPSGDLELPIKVEFESTDREKENILDDYLLTDEDQISDTEWKNREVLLMATQDIFYFDYGCVVFWGLSTREEKAAISELAAFTIDPVSTTEQSTSYDTLEYVFDRKANPQRPIRFDRMRLRSLKIEEKMALSYAMAQSSKLFVFESRVLDSVEMTRYLPVELAKNGRIDSSKKALNQRIGELFVEQTEVNLFSSILDTPDFLWDNDEHLPAYQYTRSYLEVDERVALLNSRLAVIRDLLDVLTGQVADSNSTRLEWIVIWLISVEIVMGIASNPLFAGKRVLVSMLVPVCILAYKRVNWAKVLKDI